MRIKALLFLVKNILLAIVLIFVQSSFFADATVLNNFSDYKTFDDYVIAYRKEILKVRPKLLKNQLKKLAPLTIVKANKCSLLKGVLLIHGLFVSPFTMNDMMEGVIKNNDCIVVKSLILPGHIITPEALFEIRYQDFINATDFAVKSFDKENVKDITIIGHSLGGALALNQVLKGAKKVKKIAILAPAIDLGLQSYKIAILYLINKLSHLVEKFKYIESHEDDMHLVKKDYFIPYTSFPSKAVLEVYKLTNLNKKLLLEEKKHKDVKIFAALIDNDPIVNTCAAIDILKKDVFKDVSGLIYSSNSKLNGFKNVKIVKSEDLLKRIIGLSHIGITISHKNEHVGKDAPINYGCLHFLNKKTEEEFKKCTFRKGDIYYGEITPENLKKYINLSRITYNPYFSDLLERVNKFINER